MTTAFTTQNPALRPPNDNQLLSCAPKMTRPRISPLYVHIGIASLLLAAVIPAFAVGQTNTVDPAIYGGRPIEAKPEFSNAPKYKAPTPVSSASALQGSELIAQGQAAITAANEPQASVPTSIGAAMSLWSPLRLFEHVERPTFEWARDYDASNMLKQVDFPLNLAQEKLLLETRSPEEFQYNLGKLREEIRARQAISDNPIASLLALLSTYAVLSSIPVIGLRALCKRKKLSTASTTALGTVG